MTTLQANLTQVETQMKQEMESVTAQLQAAYEQIAQRQATAAAQASPNYNSGGGGSDERGEHEDHEEGEDDD